MTRITRRQRILSLVLSLLLAFQPAILPWLTAEAAPGHGAGTARAEEPVARPTDPEIADAENFGERAMLPGEVLRRTLELRGRTAEEIEDQACADWLNTISQAYQLMEPGAEDVPAWYSALKTGRDVIRAVRDNLQHLGMVAHWTAMGAGFIAGVTKAAEGTTWIHRAIVGWVSTTKRAEGLLRHQKLLEFCKHMRTTKGLAETRDYFRWVRSIGGSNESGMSHIRGAAHTVGIGLTVISFALNTYTFFNSDDFRSGDTFSYQQVKTGVGAALALASLICMFVPGAQVVALVGLIWSILTFIGNAIGDLNKRWQAAYKNSYWYLYQQDEKFRTFYDRRRQLRDEEKAASLLIAERDFGAVLASQTATNDEEQKLLDRQRKLFTELEKQGVLMSYYYHVGANLPDSDLERLKELWSHKASFMAFKPTEEEKKKNGFFDKIKKAINPMTYVKWGADKIGSRAYLKDIRDPSLRHVDFNPDYVLVARFRNFHMLSGGTDKLSSLIGLRVEQAPFNYLPLLEFETGAWTDRLLSEALAADAFMVGTKEMVYLRQQLRAAADGAEDAVREALKSLGDVERDLLLRRRQREALAGLAKHLADDPDRKLEAPLLAACRRDLHLAWSRLGERPTGREFVEHNRADLEQLLNLLPVHLSQMVVDVIGFGLTLKNMRDTAALARALGEERQNSLTKLEKTFETQPFRKYLQRGELLGMEKGLMAKFFDWLSDVQPPAEELAQHTRLYLQEVDRYEAAVIKAINATGAKNPRTMLTAYKAELLRYRAVAREWEELAGAFDLAPVIRSDSADVYDETWDFVADFNRPIDPRAARALPVGATGDPEPVTP